MSETTPVKSADNDKILAAVATMPLIGLIMFYAMKDASPLVKHYAKQSNAVFAINIGTVVLSIILGFIPFIGCLTPLLMFVPLVAWVLVLIKALNEDPVYVLPVIGDYFDKLLK